MKREAVSTTRFGKKREAILAAAQLILYRRGLRAMTFAEVAAAVDLNPTSITYYFKRKEDLAVACLLAGAERLDAIVCAAEQGGDLADRLRRLFAAMFAHHRATRRGEEAPIPSFGEIRTLDSPYREQAEEAFVAVSRRVRELFAGPDADRPSRKVMTARTHLLVEQLFWAMNWLYQYDLDDYPRVLERVCDIYLNGLAGESAVWRGGILHLPRASEIGSREDFLIAATRLINRHGYRGASVERISAELNVTKGSFYHHIDAKEDLAVACFRRSIDIERRAQRRALETDGTQWEKLELAICTLIDFQLSDSGPLAREGLLQALPEAARGPLTERLDRVVRRFASMVADGISEGSIRAVDPLIAAQLLKVAINAAAESRAWVRELEHDEAAALYARPMLMGVLRS